MLANNPGFAIGDMVVTDRPNGQTVTGRVERLDSDYVVIRWSGGRYHTPRTYVRWATDFGFGGIV